MAKKSTNPWEARVGVPYAKKSDAQAFADFISKSPDVKNVSVFKQGNDWRVKWAKQTKRRRSNPMSKKDFESYFREEVLPYIAQQYEQDGVPDKPARREAWNDTVDAFIQDRQLPKSAENWAHPRWLETAKVRNPGTKRGGSQRGARARNTHDPAQSARSFKSAVAAADRELTAASDQLERNDVRRSVGSLVRAAYWIGEASAEKDYAGGEGLEQSRKRLKELRANMDDWGSDFAKWLKAN